MLSVSLNKTFPSIHQISLYNFHCYLTHRRHNLSGVWTCNTHFWVLLRILILSYSLLLKQTITLCWGPSKRKSWLFLHNIRYRNKMAGNLVHCLHLNTAGKVLVYFKYISSKHWFISLAFSRYILLYLLQYYIDCQ